MKEKLPLSDLLKEANSSQDDEALATGILKLLSAGVIGQAEHESLTEVHKKAFTRVPSNSVPLFEETNKITRSKQKHCPVVKIQ